MIIKFEKHSHNFNQGFTICRQEQWINLHCYIKNIQKGFFFNIKKISTCLNSMFVVYVFKQNVLNINNKICSQNHLMHDYLIVLIARLENYMLETIMFINFRGNE